MPVRGPLRGLLLALIAGVTALAVATGWVHTQIADDRAFANRTVDALAQPEVRQVVAAAVADELAVRVPRALEFRPVIEIAVEGVVASPAFRGVFVAAVRDLHRTILDGSDETVTLRLVDLVLVVKTQLAVLNPELADLIPDDLTDSLVQISADSLPGGSLRSLDAASRAAPVLPIVVLGLLGALVLTGGYTRRTLATGGVAVACGAALGYALLVGTAAVLGRSIRGALGPQADTVESAIRAELLDGAGYVATLVGSAGLVFAGSVLLSARGVRPLDLMHLARRTWLRGRGRGRRTVEWVTLAVLGGWMVLQPEAALRAAVVVTGTALVTVAVGEILRLTLPDAAADRPVDPARDSARARRAWRLHPAVAIAVIATVSGAGVAVAVTQGGGSGDARSRQAVTDPRCNGSVLLCDRRLDEVVLAMTHNSNSATSDGYVKANHVTGIRSQLDAGYRGLALDVYAGLRNPRTPSVVITDRTVPSGPERAALIADIGAAAVRAAEEIRDRALAAGGERDLYLCHALCEIGATPAERELRGIREWMDAHPREVLVIVVQDEVPAEQILPVFERAGLARLAHRQDLEDPWPTLGELIDSGRRLVVFAEQSGGEAPWWHEAYRYLQETPFSVARVEDFSCAPARGGTDPRLFLVNHFLSPPSRAKAEKANAAPVLAERLIRCQQERERLPNLVAVDFHATGQVLEVVRRLNGVPAPTDQGPGSPVS